MKRFKVWWQPTNGELPSTMVLIDGTDEHSVRSQVRRDIHRQLFSEFPPHYVKIVRCEEVEVM